RRFLETLRRYRLVELGAAEELRLDRIALASGLLVLGGARKEHFARALLADDEATEPIPPAPFDGNQAGKETGPTIEIALGPGLEGVVVAAGALELRAEENAADGDGCLLRLIAELRVEKL